MKLFGDFDIRYPNLIIDLIEYFSINPEKCEKLNLEEKSVLKFCAEKYSEKSSGSEPETIIQPQIVDFICKILCNNQIMHSIKTDSPLGTQNKYFVVIKDITSWRNDRTRKLNYFNSLVYGFDYIYRHNKENVVPIFRKEENGTYSIGTGFKLFDGIATAKHCLENTENISIKGFTADELNGKPIFISKNENLDLAFIKIEKQCYSDIYIEKGVILQEVLAMGYPKIAGFDHFLTAEKAMISSIEDFRLTTTRGDIASIADSYLVGYE